MADALADGRLDEDRSIFSAERRTLTIGLLLIMTLVASESLALTPLMPTVAIELGGFDLYGWAFSAFFLGSLIGIVVAGGLVDQGWLVRAFVGGLTFFAVGLLIGGLAPGMGILVGGRFLQGVGAGVIPPIAYVCIRRGLPESLRPKMFAMLATAWVLPGIFGPAVSAAVAGAFGWRIVFLGLIPLIVVAGAWTLPVVARLATPTGSTRANREPAAPGETSAARRRVPQAILLAASAGLALAGLTDATPIPGGVLVVVGLLVGIPMLRRLTPAGTLRAARGLPAAVLLRGILTFAFFAVEAYVPLTLQTWRGESLAVSGLAITTVTLAWTVGAWIQARMINRLGHRRLIRAGFVAVVGGTILFALVLAPVVPVAVGIVALGMAGIGMGFAYSSISLFVLREAAEGTEGIATSGLQLADVLGSVLGTGVAGAIVAIAIRGGAELWVGLAISFVMAALLGVLGLVITVRLPPRSP